jgi:hypothetical protein
VAGRKNFLNPVRWRVLCGWTLGGASFDDNQSAECGHYFKAFLKNSMTGRS